MQPCIYCRLRMGELVRVGQVLVPTCVECCAYVDRLLASGDERTKVYGWQLAILSRRYWSDRLRGRSKAA